MAESKQPLVPMSSPDLTDAEREAVSAVMNTPNLSMGSQVLAFEDAFREYSGRKHAIAVNSGTAGLHLCVRASGICRGDLVITTPFSFVATVNVLLYEGAIPVLVDVDPETGNIDPALVAQAVADLSHGGDRAKNGCRAEVLKHADRLRRLKPWTCSVSRRITTRSLKSLRTMGWRS
ncbi:MAG TPA: DegT/DnrJ/EryC1/StrS family aminotransferase [Bellilinea sp.]|nr:DegT/DnrJ/EryC1/StrS family aminotransferase [Bellilinea sp.]